MIGWARKTRGRVFHAFDVEGRGGKWLRSLCGKWMLRVDLTIEDLPAGRQRCRACVRGWLSLSDLVRGKRAY